MTAHTPGRLDLNNRGSAPFLSSRSSTHQHSIPNQSTRKSQAILSQINSGKGSPKKSNHHSYLHLLHHNHHPTDMHNNSSTMQSVGGASSISAGSSASFFESLERKKSPSCKTIFGEALTSKRIPISMLSVTKYADLLAIEDNDPRNPDISLHIPIDNQETRDSIMSFQSAVTLTSTKEKRPTVFMPFRQVKEINRNEFLRMHQDIPSFQSLDFHDLGGNGGKSSQKSRNSVYSSNESIASNSSARGGGILSYNNNRSTIDRIKEVHNERESLTPPGHAIRTEPDEENSYRKAYQSKSQMSSSNSARPLSKIEYSLMHNKDIKVQLDISLLRESMSSYDDVKQRAVRQEEVIKRMPKIRKYPIFKMKPGAVVSSIEEEEPEQTKQTAPNNRKNSLEGNAKLAASGGAAANDSTEKKVRFNKIDHDSSYPIYWYSFEQNNWKPDIRESQTLVIDEKKGYLFGGVGNKLYNQLTELNLEDFKWKEMKVEGNVPNPRFGHSCCVYKRNLVFFGGEVQSMQNNLKLKECLFEVHFYNMDTKTWKFVPCSGGPLQPRKNHAATLIGRNLLISGGSNTRDQILKDVWFLDFGTQTWSEASVQSDIEVNFHSCAPVYHSQRCGKINLYKQSDIKITKWGAQIAQEGVYFFGGKGAGGQVYSDLRILRTDCKPMQWIRPETVGQAPKPRYGHSMNYSQELNMLVIHGGKNDNDDAVFFGDTYILNVEDYNWVQLASYGSIQPPRSNHSAAIFESKLIIFGGLNLDGFLAPFLSVLELDGSAAKKMHEKDIADAEMLQQQAFARGSMFTSNLRKAQNGENPFGISQQLQSIRIQDISGGLGSIHKIPDEQKALVDSLSFQNFKSFLPIPRLSSQASFKSGGTPSLRKSILANSKLNSKVPTPTGSPKSKN